jgi:hypothetical protein
MGLMTWEDYRAPAYSNPSQPVYKLLPSRLRSMSPTPMPPEGALSEPLLAAIDSWVNAGAPDCGFDHAPGYVPPSSGTGSARNLGTGAAPNFGTGAAPNYGSGGAPNLGNGGVPNFGGAPPQGGAPPVGNGGAGPSGIDPTPYLSPDGTYFIKEPPGDLPLGPDALNSDYCFNILAHGGQTPLPQDPSPYQVRASEYYHAFNQKVPYDRPFWALSTRPIIDNNRVLHHWLLFRLGGTAVDGTHVDEIGLQLNNELITGWAPGGNPLDMPDGVGLDMPPPGSVVLMETH